MKKLVLATCILAATALSTSAQTKKTTSMPKNNSAPMAMMSSDSPTGKGKWLVGGSIGLTSHSEQDDPAAEKNTTSTMSIQPGVSYFIQDDLAVGLVLGFGSFNQKVAAVVNQKRSSMFVAPSVRYYMPIGNHFKFFGQLLVPIGSIKTTVSGGADVDFKTQFMGVDLMPGFAFFPSKKISIEMSLGSINFQTTKTGDAKTSDLTVNFLGQTIDATDLVGTPALGTPTIGFKFHLGK